MRGVSLHWFRDLFEQQAVGDIWGSFCVLCTWPNGNGHHGCGIDHGRLAFRKRFVGSTVLFYLVITSLVIPSILISWGLV